MSTLQDFLLWTKQQVFDTIRIERPPISEVRNITVNPAIVDQTFEVQIRGTILQALRWNLAINNGLTVQFNEQNTPTYKLDQGTTFRFPFYRLWITAAAGTAGSFQVATGREVLTTEGVGVQLIGPTATTISQFDKTEYRQAVLPVGGSTDLYPANIPYSWVKIREMRIVNTSAEDLLIRGKSDPAGAGYPVWASHEKVLSFGSAYFLNLLAGASAANRLVLENPATNVNPATVELLFFFEGV